MTFTESAEAMRRCADGIDKVIRSQGKDTQTGNPTPMLDGDAAIGAALMLIYLRDLFTAANRDQWDRPSILVALEAISRDQEVFPTGVGRVMWQCEEDED